MVILVVCVCVCVCVCVLDLCMLCIFLVESCFESLTSWLDLWLCCLLVHFIFMCISSLWKISFLQAWQLLDRSLTNSFLSSPSFFSSQQKLTQFWSIEIYRVLNKSLTTSLIHQETFYLANKFSTDSRSVETLLHTLFFTCFESFYYLVIHSILFYYIHAFIWIPCAPLIIFDHLYVSWVKFYSFLYPCQ